MRPAPETCCKARGVRDHQERRTGLGHERKELLHHLVRCRLVEVAGRLVREDQLWPRRERAGDRHALLLAARQLLRIFAQLRFEAERAGQP